VAVPKGRTSLSHRTRTLGAGDVAPDFTLPTHKGEEWRLSDHKGRKVVLAFYPFAFSPTCSTQVPSYEGLLDRFSTLDADIAGISTDHHFANNAWAESFGGFSFPLLCDFEPRGAVSERYGVLRENGTAERTIVVVDREGTIAYVDVHALREQPDEEQIFEELRKLP
jgi:peroxiredoxin (alkyl hydroperoxide reductase subunit C)